MTKFSEVNDNNRSWPGIKSCKEENSKSCCRKKQEKRPITERNVIGNTYMEGTVYLCLITVYLLSCPKVFFLCLWQVEALSTYISMQGIGDSPNDIKRACSYLFILAMKNSNNGSLWNKCKRRVNKKNSLHVISDFIPVYICESLLKVKKIT